MVREKWIAGAVATPFTIALSLNEPALGFLAGFVTFVSVRSLAREADSRLRTSRGATRRPTPAR